MNGVPDCRSVLIYKNTITLTFKWNIPLDSVVDVVGSGTSDEIFTLVISLRTDWSTCSMTHSIYFSVQQLMSICWPRPSIVDISIKRSYRGLTRNIWRASESSQQNKSLCFRLCDVRHGSVGSIVYLGLQLSIGAKRINRVCPTMGRDRITEFPGNSSVFSKAQSRQFLSTT